MATQQCLNNIKQEPPPYNIPCTEPFCVKTRPARDAHCTNAGKSPDTPVLSWDPAIGESCYCCCSCYTLDTPIAVSKKDFVLIQDIKDGDTVMTTGLDLAWKPGKVQHRSGDIDPTMVPGLYLVRYKMENETEHRQLIVTADHLFMMADDKTLKKVQNLIPNDGLLAANGTTARVVFVVHGDYNTAIQSIEMEGVFDGTDLTGHLLNANGIVSTDFKVQAWYEANENATSWENSFGNKSAVLSVGEPDYIKEFNCKEIGEFLDDPDLWPVGFVPERKPLVNVPVTAYRFLTKKQALEVDDNGIFNPVSSSRDTIEKTLNIYKSSYPEINFVLDWYDNTANAYSWTSSSQQYVLITGKLARVQQLYTNGLALIIADMITRLNLRNCVAEADYESLNTMRLLWPNSILAVMAPEGIKEVEKAVFSLIRKNRKGNPDDVCSDPGIDCRLESFKAGLAFFPMPECGIPPSQEFILERSYANFDLTAVEVIFSENVDEATGSSPVNYSISNDVAVKDAKVDGKKVTLSVEGLEFGKRYIMEVGEVMSVYSVLIQPNPSLTIISIPKVG